MNRYDPQLALWRKFSVLIIVVSLVSIAANVFKLMEALK